MYQLKIINEDGDLMIFEHRKLDSLLKNCDRIIKSLGFKEIYITEIKKHRKG